MEDHNNQTTQDQDTDLFLKELRASTAPMHEKLEANYISAGLMKPGVSRAHYSRYLMLMGEVNAFYEKNIFPAVRNLIDDIDERQKSQHIHADLHYLQDTSLPAGTPIFYPLELSFTIPFALGYMYVIEGSTLGGRVILKHVKSALGLDEEHGASFFGGYGPDTGMRWKKFLAVLCDYAVTHHEQKEIIAGAMHAFESIDQYLDVNSGPHEN